MAKQPMYRGKPIGGSKAKKAPSGPPDADRVKAALKKLQELHDAKLITDAEYQRKKSDLLDLL